MGHPTATDQPRVMKRTGTNGWHAHRGADLDELRDEAGVVHPIRDERLEHEREVE